MSRNGSVENRSPCAVCHVVARSDWCVLGDSQLDRLGRARQRREYRRGESVFTSGLPSKGIHCISSGLIGIRRTDEAGSSVLVSMAGPGETLGYRSFLLGVDHQTSAEALETSVVCFVDRATIAALLAEAPELGLQFLRRASREVAHAQESVMRRVALSNRARLVHLLLVLMQSAGRVDSDGAHTLRLPFSRLDMAAMVGTRHETLSRIIGRLEKEGIAKFSGRNVRVNNLDNLVEEIDEHLHE